MRSTAKVSLTLGVLPIPVRLYQLSEGPDNILCEAHIVKDEQGKITHISRVGRKNYCKGCGAELKSGDPTYQHGFEASKDQIIPIFDEELDAIRPQSSKTIEILGLWKIIKDDEQDAEETFIRNLILYADSKYLLEPEDVVKKAYICLRDELLLSGRIAYGKITFRGGREHLAIILPFKGVLLLITIVYANEIRMSYIETVKDEIKDVTPQDREREMFKAFMQSLFPEEEEEEKFESLEDEYAKNKRKLIEAKIQGETMTVEIQEPPEPAEDLMAQIVVAMEQAKTKKKKAKAEE